MVQLQTASAQLARRVKMTSSYSCAAHRSCIVALFFLVLVSAAGLADVQQPNTNTDALIEKQINSIIELEPAGRDFYVSAAKKAGQVGGSGCILGALSGAMLGFASGGPVGSAFGAAKGCVGAGFVSSLIAAIDAPFQEWTRSNQAAYRARKAYTLSFAWLDIDAFDLVGADPPRAQALVNGQFRKCALRYHPDKLPDTASERHRDSASVKLANCRFAKSYVLAFWRKYGMLDPEDTGRGAQEFLEKFAGAWAAAFGAHDRGDGALTPDQVAEWMAAIKHHAAL